MTLRSLGIQYDPWVGPDYGVGRFPGLRILVLGESHYTWRRSGDSSDLTQWCVKEYALGTERRRFFTLVASLLTGERPVSAGSKRDVWNSVSFYNYVQERVGRRARTRPTAAMWSRSGRPFMEVLRQLRPDVVIALGLSLWSNMPPADREGPTIGTLETCEYSIGRRSRSVLACGMRHPCGRGFVLRPNIKAASAMMTYARERRLRT